MTRAIEKLAARLGRHGHTSPSGHIPPNEREIICHRCGVHCVVTAGAALDDTICIGCQQRLGVVGDERRRAVRYVADWWDKAAAPGPGYGVVTCPHCATSCVVEVGSAARTGCVACLRPLGAAPLVRTDLAPHAAVAILSNDADDTTQTTPWIFADGESCVLFPGEMR